MVILAYENVRNRWSNRLHFCYEEEFSYIKGAVNIMNCFFEDEDHNSVCSLVVFCVPAYLCKCFVAVVRIPLEDYTWKDLAGNELNEHNRFQTC